MHARIVNVTSEAHRLVNVYDLKAVTTCQTEFRDHFVAYGVSKLALLLFTKELSKKLSSKLMFSYLILQLRFQRNHIHFNSFGERGVRNIPNCIGIIIQ